MAKFDRTIEHTPPVDDALAAYIDDEIDDDDTPVNNPFRDLVSPDPQPQETLRDILGDDTYVKVCEVLNSSGDIIYDEGYTLRLSVRGVLDAERRQHDVEYIRAVETLFEDATRHKFVESSFNVLDNASTMYRQLGNIDIRQYHMSIVTHAMEDGLRRTLCELFDLDFAQLEVKTIANGRLAVKLIDRDDLHVEKILEALREGSVGYWVRAYGYLELLDNK